MPPFSKGVYYEKRKIRKDICCDHDLTVGRWRMGFG